MNAVEIEAAVSELASTPFDAAEFPFAFLAAFGNKETTLAKLRKGVSNGSDIPNGVLQRNNIHLAVARVGEVGQTLTALKDSPKTVGAKAKFILATDGEILEAEELGSGEAIASEYANFAEHFGFFLPLAGITTVKEIKDNPIDIRATGRLNKLYIELLKENPDWATEARRPDLNHFLARLIFCFFAEDTDIFMGSGTFTATVQQMSSPDASNVHLVLSEIFRAMDIKPEAKEDVGLPHWAKAFPYVNGNLFSDNTETPKFSKIARSYLIRAGELNWREINPDIFGSMIQAVADDEERGSLGMHYTSVPNILKVLNPLFLDDLREQLEKAEDHKSSLLKLRERMSRIRVFDPACGSGNFLVIAYKEMRGIEGEINRRRGEVDRPSEVHLTNFRGIEIRDFAAEIARLALIIAEFQCDVLLRGPKLALAEFLPLNSKNWIVCGNSLRWDWATVCPPTGKGVSLVPTAADLFDTPLDQPKIHFHNEGGETYICGNPQFKGARKQSRDQKRDMELVFGGGNEFKDCDYVTAWYLKAAKFLEYADAAFAFVSTSSISEGEQVAHLWSRLYRAGLHIQFAHLGFKWGNNAAKNAAVQCVIIGVRGTKSLSNYLYEGETKRQVGSISPYLIAGEEMYVCSEDRPLSRSLSQMVMGSMARDDGNLILTIEDASILAERYPTAKSMLRTVLGSQELIHVRNRKCLWIEDSNLEFAMQIPPVKERIEKVKVFRQASPAKTTRGYATISHKFAQRAHQDSLAMIVAATSSEERDYIPADILDQGNIVTNAAYAVYGVLTWELALVVSRLHMVWIRAVCGKLETRLRYSTTLGWNTFPVTTLTEQNKADLTRCAEEILLARERHFPETIADLYDPETMPEDLRRAHEKNDETLERIYIGRRFKNDTERLEKLFDLYAKMTANAAPVVIKTRKKAGVPQTETIFDTEMVQHEVK